MSLSFTDASGAIIGPVFTGTSVNVGLSTSTNRSAALAVGLHLVSCDVSVSVKQGGATVNAVAADWTLPANTVMPLRVTVAATDGYLAGILGASTGTLKIIAVASE